jgi:hypothetical protein
LMSRLPPPPLHVLVRLPPCADRRRHRQCRLQSIKRTRHTLSRGNAEHHTHATSSVSAPRALPFFSCFNEEPMTTCLVLL